MYSLFYSVLSTEYYILFYSLPYVRSTSYSTLFVDLIINVFCIAVLAVLTSWD